MTTGTRLASKVLHAVWRAPQYATSNQVHPHHVEAIAKAGFRTIVALRPEAETPGQPSIKEVFEAARKHGIKTFYVPVSNNAEAPDPKPGFIAALAKAEGPILGYCRSGQRAATIWHQSFPWNSKRDPATVVGKLIKDHDQFY